METLPQALQLFRNSQILSLNIDFDQASKYNKTSTIYGTFTRDFLYSSLHRRKRQGFKYIYGLLNKYLIL
jgi:hypothetical protein